MYVEITGKGDPLLLIHGWGMHGGMWGQVADQLAQTHTVHRVDLPGHGQSKWSAAEGEGAAQNALSLTLSRFAPYPSFPRKREKVQTRKTIFNSWEREQNLLDEIVAQLSSQFDEPLSVMGWSLGGQVALRWAQLHPAQVRKLVLVATTPCFVQKENWSCAMAADTLQEFAASLLQNHALTLKRFLALQVRGSENEKEILSNLRAQLFAKGEPDVAALKGGLEILRDTDLRAQLPAIAQPALLIAGERDTLTPKAASEYMAQALPNARLEIIQGAAHAPFLSHREQVVTAMLDFLKNNN